MLLIDAGLDEEGDEVHAFLQDLRITSLDAFLRTHYGGIDKVVDAGGTVSPWYERREGLATLPGCTLCPIPVGSGHVLSGPHQHGHRILRVDDPFLGSCVAAMRLFVALNLPKKERDRIYRASRILRDCELPVRWKEPEHYHVTLKFLGEVTEDRLEGVQDALNQVASTTGRLDLAVEGFGAFPTIRRPQVIWVGVEPSPALRCLKQDVEWALMGCGFERETRAFHPHLTLGRADAQDGAGVFRGLDDKAANLAYQGQIMVRKLDLMRSHLSKGGAPKYSLKHSTSFEG